MPACIRSASDGGVMMSWSPTRIRVGTRIAPSRSVESGRSSIARIAASGLDHVRVPINSRLVQAPDGEPLEEGYALLDDVVGWMLGHRRVAHPVGDVAEPVALEHDDVGALADFERPGLAREPERRCRVERRGDERLVGGEPVERARGRDRLGHRDDRRGAQIGRAHV